MAKKMGGDFSSLFFFFFSFPGRGEASRFSQ